MNAKYQMIAEELRNKIHQQEYQVNEPIPSQAHEGAAGEKRKFELHAQPCSQHGWNHGKSKQPICVAEDAIAYGCNVSRLLISLV